MAKQTFTTGSVLTATQMNNLQANDYNWTVSQKTASYVLVAADAGTRIEMNVASANTVTVNTGLFTAGDTVIIQNVGAGTTTVTAGTATVTTASSLSLAQYQSGVLYFSSASAAIFFGDSATPAAGSTITRPKLVAPTELTTVSATAATGTINLDVMTQGVLYYTSNASANFTLNVRGNGSTTLNSLLSVGDAITITFLNTNGSTAYYPTVYQIDGSAVTPKWITGTAPTGGNASAIDAYLLTIIKTAATPTYVVLASQTKYA